VYVHSNKVMVVVPAIISSQMKVVWMNKTPTLLGCYIGPDELDINMLKIQYFLTKWLFINK